MEKEKGMKRKEEVGKDRRENGRENEWKSRGTEKEKGEKEKE